MPELLEGTYRTHKQIGAFRLLTTEPAKFLGQDGVSFTYEYVDADLLTRRGDARAAIIAGKLYMITFDAPRLHYFDRSISDFRALVSSAKLRRSEERRGGKECVRQCRSRWSPYL